MTGRIGIKDKATALLFGAFAMLIAIPAMSLYATAISGTKPIDYSLWEIIYFLYALVVLFA